MVALKTSSAIDRARMKEPQADDWPVSRYPMEGSAWLHRDIIVTKDGVSAQPSVTPVTIVPARYHGIYEGAPWICFPVHPQWLTEESWRDWDGEERDCRVFWQRPHVQELLIGRGDSPTAAYDDLIGQACARAGVDRAALTGSPDHTVPMVIGLTYHDAAGQLRHAGYQATAITPSSTPAQHGTGTMHAVVIAQQPAPGIPAHPGAIITLTIRPAGPGSTR